MTKYKNLKKDEQIEKLFQKSLGIKWFGFIPAFGPIIYEFYLSIINIAKIPKVNFLELSETFKKYAATPMRSRSRIISTITILIYIAPILLLLFSIFDVIPFSIWFAISIVLFCLCYFFNILFYFYLRKHLAKNLVIFAQNFYGKDKIKTYKDVLKLTKK